MAPRTQRPHKPQPHLSGQDTGYPSLSDHRRQRRRFLAGGAALMGGGLLAACTRPFGFDSNNNETNAPGGVEEPQYYSLRFPETGEASVWLMDGGYATFHVTALTCHQDGYAFALDNRSALTTAIGGEIDEFSYDELVTASRSTMDSVRDAVQACLNEAYNADTGETGDTWFEDVEVELTRLDPPEEIGGVAGPEPAYP